MFSRVGWLMILFAHTFAQLFSAVFFSMFSSVGWLMLFIRMHFQPSTLSSVLQGGRQGGRQTLHWSSLKEMMVDLSQSVLGVLTFKEKGQYISCWRSPQKNSKTWFQIFWTPLTPAIQDHINKTPNCCYSYMLNLWFFSGGFNCQPR